MRSRATEQKKEKKEKKKEATRLMPCPWWTSRFCMGPPETNMRRPWGKGDEELLLVFWRDMHKTRDTRSQKKKFETETYRLTPSWTVLVSFCTGVGSNSTCFFFFLPQTGNLPVIHSIQTCAHTKSFGGVFVFLVSLLLPIRTSNLCEWVIVLAGVSKLLLCPVLPPLTVAVARSLTSHSVPKKPVYRSQRLW